MGLEYPRSARLTESAAFRAVRAGGKSWTSRCLILGALARSGETTRFGVVTSRRVGNAVVRNKVRRRLREIIRHHRQRVQDGFWIVIVARHAAAQANFQILEDELLRLFKRASILHPAA